MKNPLLLLASALALVALMTAQTLAAEVTIRGSLGRTVEAGGWLIHTAGEKYLLLNARRFQNETWFRESAEVEATGEVRRDAVTIYQEGVPFEARTMRPSGGDSAGGKATAGRYTHVRVTGDAVVRAQPDTAVLSISVVTQSKSALDAQRENAARSEAVVRAVNAGAGAEVKTSGYALTPQRAYKQGQPPTITGYEARNSVTVTTGDLTRVGAVIDAAAQAGANNIDAVSFILNNDRPARGQALAEATREAVGKAEAVARALGGRVLRVVEVREDGATPRPVYQARAVEFATARVAADAPTPIEVGTLDIRSQVRLVAEVETGR